MRSSRRAPTGTVEIGQRARLNEHVRRGHLGDRDVVVVVHSGGLPATVAVEDGGLATSTARTSREYAV
jgi:hypothetical protein